jgi:hypothetical protein
MAKRDYYELLGVSRDASDADIEEQGPRRRLPRVPQEALRRLTALAPLAP